MKSDSCSGNSLLFPFFLPALEFKELYQSYFQANYITLVLLDDFNVFLKMKICQPARSWIQIPHLMTAPMSISSFILWSNSNSRNVHYPHFFVNLILLFVFFEVWSRRSIYLFNIFNLSFQSWVVFRSRLLQYILRSEGYCNGTLFHNQRFCYKMVFSISTTK